jgi:hypothetical protein
MTKELTLIIATDIVVDGRFTRIEELHRSTCADLLKKKNSKEYKYAGYTEFASIEEARAWYNEDDFDEEEMSWEFDEEVNVLPCTKH